MSKQVISAEQIVRRIFYFRGEKVLLDFDLATLYGVATKALNQAVKRNRERFPDDFMFQLTTEEVLTLRSQTVISSIQGTGNQEITTNWSQIVTSSRKHRGTKYRPYAFTEEGIAMLSSVLHSERALKVNIAIMRAFVKLRGMLDTNRELARKFAELERRVGKQDEEIAAILEAIRQLMAPPERPRPQIGLPVQEKPPRYRTANRR